MKSTYGPLLCVSFLGQPVLVLSNTLSDVLVDSVCRQTTYFDFTFVVGLPRANVKADVLLDGVHSCAVKMYLQNNLTEIF